MPPEGGTLRRFVEDPWLSYHRTLDATVDAVDDAVDIADSDVGLAGHVSTEVDESPAVFERPDRLVVGDLSVRERYRRDGLGGDSIDRAAESAREVGRAELARDADAEALTSAPATTLHGRHRGIGGTDPEAASPADDAKPKPAGTMMDGDEPEAADATDGRPPVCEEPGCTRRAGVLLHVPWDEDRSVCPAHARVLARPDGVVAEPIEGAETEWP